MRTRVWFLVLPLIVVGSALSQTPPTAPDKSAPDYSKEGFVLNHSKTTASFNADGTQRRESTAEVHITGDAGMQRWGVLGLDYAGAVEKPIVTYVRVRKPDGTVVNTPAENMQDMPAEVTRTAPFYSDLRQLQIAVKGLSVGDVLEYQLAVESTKALVPGHFWFEYNFSTEVIALDEELEIKFPRDQFATVKSPRVKPTITEEGAWRIYTWKNSHPQHEEAKKFPIGRAPASDVQVTNFRSWQELGNWWSSLAQSMSTPTPEITAKAAELTKDAKNDDDKMRAIFKYVSTGFRYIGISFGIGRFQPHTAAEVLSNQYGDCKDKHTLLAALLQASGIQAYPALLSSQREIDPDVPSPQQFNHVITVVPRGDKYIWLDSTIEVSPFGYLIRPLRGKRALVLSKSEAPVLTKIPPDLPYPTTQTYDIDAKIGEDGVLKGHVRRTARGDFEVLLRAALRSVPPNNWKEIVQGASQISGFAGEVSNVVVSTANDTEKPLEWSYDYTRKDYPGWNRQFSAPIGFMGLAPIDDTSLASLPVLLAGPGQIVLRAIVEFPAGYSLSPCAPFKVDYDFATYSSSCEWNGHTLKAEHKLALKVSELPPARDADYATFQKAVTDNEAEEMTIMSAGAQQVVSDFASAQKLFEEGREAVMQRDFQKAVDRLERAGKQAPNLPQIWKALAFAYANLNKPEDAATNLRKAIAADSKDLTSYKLLAGILSDSLNRTDEAMRVLRDGLKIDPNDPDLHGITGQLLLKMKKPADAALQLQTAVSLSHDNDRYSFILAHAYKEAGQDEKAMQVYAALVKLDSSPVVLNDVAWDMAEQDFGLDTALKYSQQAVQASEEKTRTLELNKLSQEDVVSADHLASSWDTLGWIYYRHGDLAEAEKYLYAAWTLSQKAAMGDRLGQVYEAQGRNADAAHLYALAVAVDGRFSEGRSHLDRAYRNRAAAEAAVEKARNELSQSRLTKLPLLAAKGSAEFFVLLSAGGKVEDTKFISGSDELRSASKALAALHYKVPLPDVNGERIIRRGILSCQQVIHRCDFLLYTPDMVQSVN